MRIIDADEISRRLTYKRAIAIVAKAMIDFSAGATRQPLRQIVPCHDGWLLGVMPGALAAGQGFGAKLISVHPGHGKVSHQGYVLLFDPDSGAAVCMADAYAVTAIRTAAASAVATDALARVDAGDLAILGTGEQAATHARAMLAVRPLRRIRLWGRDPARAARLAAALAAELGLPVTAHDDVAATVRDADIICTVTGAVEPILASRDVADGAHVSAVGSSFAGPAEIDNALVARARVIADSRAGVLTQGGEFLRAKAAGLVDDDHIVGEIGEVLAGRVAGRETPDQVTLYKSLGHIVQDLACVWALYRQPA